MTRQMWFSRIAVALSLGWVAAVFVYSVRHPGAYSSYMSRLAIVAAAVVPAILLAGIAKVFVRIRHGSWKELTLLEIPHSWERAIRIAVWVAVAIELSVLALGLISGRSPFRYH